VLRRLLDRHDHGKPKDDERWYRDLLLAADIGVDRDWNYLREQGLATDELRRTLAKRLATMLNDRRQLLPVAERVRAGFLLGDLGDPRFPLTFDDWRNELAKIAAGDESGYFCRIPAGRYLVGSSDDDPEAGDEEKPQYQFQLQQDIWIARYPVTNAQWQAWVAVGGEQSRFADATDVNGANQPVVGVTWHWCNSFCEWFSNAVASRLPDGYVLRLPMEAEWEAAARGGDGRIYPWGYGWAPDYAATQEDKATREWEWSTPVGCYPTGAAPCGAIDMAGNVDEWTADIWQSHLGAKEAFVDDELRIVKGGYYSGERVYVRCSARDRDYPVVFGLYSAIGFRIVVAPPLAHVS
jgi:formylglycine-generating enzyme required for sulfatase activity